MSQVVNTDSAPYEEAPILDLNGSPNRARHTLILFSGQILAYFVILLWKGVNAGSVGHCPKSTVDEFTDLSQMVVYSALISLMASSHPRIKWWTIPFVSIVACAYTGITQLPALQNNLSDGSQWDNTALGIYMALGITGGVWFLFNMAMHVVPYRLRKARIPKARQDTFLLLVAIVSYVVVTLVVVYSLRDNVLYRLHHWQVGVVIALLASFPWPSWYSQWWTLSVWHIGAGVFVQGVTIYRLVPFTDTEICG